jgi:hypothetical protein
MEEDRPRRIRRAWFAGPPTIAVLAFAGAIGVGSANDRAVVWCGWFLAVVLLGAVVWWGRLTLGASAAPLSWWKTPAVLSGLAVLGSCAAAVRDGMLAWHSTDFETVGPDGTTYVLLSHGFMDADLVLTRRTWSVGVGAGYDVLARLYSEPALRPRVAWPSGLAREGLIVRDGCVAAYSGCGILVASTAGGAAPSSPFCLIGPDDRPDESDVDSIVDAIGEAVQAHDWRDDLPTDAGLVEALASQNPHVRDAAARLVRAGGAQRYPQATKFLR